MKPDYVWLCDGPKGRVSGKTANEAFEKYINTYGKRGKLHMSRNIREGDMLVWTGGEPNFIGTASEIYGKLPAFA